MSAVFDEWIQGDVGDVFVQHFDAALANWHGEPPGVCIFSEECGPASSVGDDDLALLFPVC